MKRRAADMDRLDQEDSQRKRARMAQRQAAKQPQPVVNESMELDIGASVDKSDTDFDFLAIENPKIMVCSFDATILNQEGLPVLGGGALIGNLYKPPMGFSVKLQLDAGQYGLPFIRLLFSKGKQNTTDWKRFSIEWRPGVAVQKLLFR